MTVDPPDDGVLTCMAVPTGASNEMAARLAVPLWAATVTEYLDHRSQFLLTVNSKPQ